MDLCYGKTDVIKYYWEKIYFPLFTFLYALIPCVVILISSILIIRKVKQSVPKENSQAEIEANVQTSVRRTENTMQPNTQKHSKIMTHQVQVQNSAFDRHGARIVKMCISISIAFLITTLVSLIGFINLLFRRDEVESVIVQRLANSLAMLNHNINVILYCLVSSEFRSDVAMVFCKWCRR